MWKYTSWPASPALAYSVLYDEQINIVYCRSLFFFSLGFCIVFGANCIYNSEMQQLTRMTVSIVHLLLIFFFPPSVWSCSAVACFVRLLSLFSIIVKCTYSHVCIRDVKGVFLFIGNYFLWLCLEWNNCWRLSGVWPHITFSYSYIWLFWEVNKSAEHIRKINSRKEK